jgi:5-methylcytosine-specific restriction endonuclease McrA
MTAALKNDYDTLTTSPERGPAFYLARHLRKRGLRQEKGDGRLGRFRETSRYKQTSVADVVRDRLDRCVTSEFRFYEWNVLTLCAYCSARLTKRSVTRDHVVPQSRGGPSTPDNLVPCCGPCNRQKSNKPLWKFLLERRHPAPRADRLAAA